MPASPQGGSGVPCSLPCPHPDLTSHHTALPTPRLQSSDSSLLFPCHPSKKPSFIPSSCPFTQLYSLLTPLSTAHSGIFLLIVRLPDWRAASCSQLCSSCSSLGYNRSLGSICGVNEWRTNEVSCHIGELEKAAVTHPVASGLLKSGQL